MVVTPVFSAVLSLSVLIAGETSVLDAGERQTFALIADAPSEVIQHAGSLFRKHTDLAPLEIPPEAIDGCGGSPVCIALRARAQLEERSASFLAVISNVSGRISAVLIDLEQALRCADQGGEEEAIADCATERALVATSLGQAVEDREALRRHVEMLILEVFRPALEKAGHWEPFGSIDVKIERAVVSLDGKALGSVAGRAQIEGVRPGNRKLAFEQPGTLPQEISVEVKRGEIASLSIELASNAAIHSARTITLWSGVGVAALGAGVTIWAAIASASSSAPDVYCSSEDCSGRDFRTIAQLTGDEGDHTGPPEGGVLALPLGYSIVAAGAGFALGALFVGDDEDLPWIAWLVGIAAGGLSYGLSALLD